METSEPRRRSGAALAGLVALALVAGGCGGSGVAGGSGSTTSAGAQPRGFAWLRPAAAPAGWASARIGNGAVLFYPPGWRISRGDLGTATVALLGARGAYRGYLNLTPRQGSETLANWAAFRVRHNREEGERDVRGEGAARGLRFRTGRGSCVRDAYTTSTRTRYIEIACLVQGAHASAVVVGAAPVSAWASASATIERAIAALTT
jgi:hypothetical protein